MSSNTVQTCGIAGGVAETQLAPAQAPDPHPNIDLDAIRRYRVGRLTEQIELHGLDLMVLLTTPNLRYAADWREYPNFQSHSQTYDLFVKPGGQMTLFGGYSADHPTIDSFGPTHAMNGFDGGLDLAARANAFAADVYDVVGAGGRVAVEHVNPSAVQALEELGLTVIDADPIMEQARMVKSPDEVDAMRYSIEVAQYAMSLMAQATRPGITENQLFSILHQVNVAYDGDWIDGRMLCSGPRTNPWYQQATARVIDAGDVVAFDTDMIGPFGYAADISRTWVTPGNGPIPPEIRDLHNRAKAEIAHNADLLKVGMSFSEFSQRAFTQDDQFTARRYACVAHGLGLTDEYPRVAYRQDWETMGYDGEFVADTVICIESFVGSDQGGPGVKLEDTYLLTDDGAHLLTDFPLDLELDQ